MRHLFWSWFLGLLGIVLLLSGWSGPFPHHASHSAAPPSLLTHPPQSRTPAWTLAATTPMTTIVPLAPPSPLARVALDTATTTAKSLVLSSTVRMERTYIFPVRAEWYEYGRYHHDYPATDIFCPVGSEYLATTSGVVDFVNAVDQWDATTNDPALRGGIMIAIIGDDGWRYYGSHLSVVAEGLEVGDRVVAGQLLGYTGKSGNAQGTPPHIHYGISHPTTPDDWQTRRGQIPPYDYLQAWERGEMVTPHP